MRTIPMNRQHHRRLHMERLEERRMLSGMPGDFDASGTMDAADYTVWRDGLGSETPLVNDDGLGTPIGPAHYQLWKANFGSSASYPPILLTINVHGHNYGFPERASALDNWKSTKQDRYDSDKEQILWIADLAESVGAQVNYQLNGEYCRDARVLNGDDTAHLATLEDEGHVMGSHFHMYRFSGENEFWKRVSTATASQANLEEIWSDQVGECEQTLGHTLFRIDPAIMSLLVDSDAIVEDLREASQPQIEPGAETFSYTDWNQKPWNPFRRMRGTSLTEDPNRDILAVTSIGQVGQLVPAGKHQIMASVGQIQRQFLALVAEWRENERLGRMPKVWQFGIMTHPHQNITYQKEMQEIVEWLATWTEQTTDQGNAIAEFATDAKVLERFKQWEESYPGESSFDYDWEAYLAGNPEPYPYQLEGVSLGLKDAELDEQLTDWQEEEVTVFRMYKREVVRGPINSEGLRSMEVRDLYEEPLYLLWSTTGESVEIDFAAEQSGTLYHVDGETGELTTVDAGSLTVPPTAVLVSAIVDGLVEAMRHPETRMPAFATIRTLEPKAAGAKDAMHEHLNAEDAYIRCGALLALDSTGRRPMKEIDGALNDHFPTISTMATECLALMGADAAAALPALKRAANSPTQTDHSCGESVVGKMRSTIEAIEQAIKERRVVS